MATSLNAQDQEILRTLQAYKAGHAPQVGMLKPDVMKDWNISTGFQAYNLLPVALVLLPQLTPIRNITKRTPGNGKLAEYKAVTALNNTNLQGWVAEGSAASIVQTTVTDHTATYKSFALGDKVTFEGQWSGVGFVDAKALAAVNLLRAAMIAEETAILFGQRNGSVNSTEQGPGAVGTPSTLTSSQVVCSGAAGNFANVSYDIVQTVVTGMGESLPSAVYSFTPSANNSVAVTPIFPTSSGSLSQPVLGFKIYIRTTGGPGTWYEMIPANMSGAVSQAGDPTLGCTLPGGSLHWYTNGTTVTMTAIPTGSSTPPVSDGSASSLAFNGIYPQMIGGSCPNLYKANGALTLTMFNTLFRQIWDNAKGDPDAIWLNSLDSLKLTTITIPTGAPYHAMVDDAGAATANFRVSRIVNPVTGTVCQVRVHPVCPQGTVLYLSSRLPGWYVPTEITSVWDMDMCQDYVEIDYPPNQSNPFWQLEVRFYGALKLFLPLIQGAIYCASNN